MITSRKAWSMYTSTVTRFYISLCISCLTSSTDWPQKHSAKGTTIHPFGPFIIPLQVSTHGWAHWWFNMSAPPCLPPSPLSVFLPPLRWNLKAKSGGCWEMNFRKRFHSFHNTVSPSPLTVSLPFLLVQALSHLISKSKDNIHYVVTQYICCEMMQCLRPK